MTDNYRNITAIEEIRDPEKFEKARSVILVFL